MVQRFSNGAALLAVIALATPGAAAPSKVRASERNGDRASGKAATGRAAAPAGPLQIMISLQHQRLTVFNAGVPIASSTVSSGQSGFETPRGIYSILQKNRYHESNIYSGAPMPYMQRITWSGIALHEGNLPGYPASHGCIRLPGAFASSLFGMTKVGGRVIVSRDPLTPRPFEHDKLFKPQLAAAPMAVVQMRGQGAAAEAGGLVINTAVAMPRSNVGSALNPPVVSDGQVAILISRHTGKIYIRRNFQPVYEGAIDIQQGGQCFF